MNWEWILFVVGIVLLCVAFYAYLSEPVGKAVKEAEDAGYIIRRPVYERTDSSPMMMPETCYPYDGLPEDSSVSDNILVLSLEVVNSEKYSNPIGGRIALSDPLVAVRDVPKIPKKLRKVAKITGNESTKST